MRKIDLKKLRKTAKDVSEKMGDDERTEKQKEERARKERVDRAMKELTANLPAILAKAANEGVMNVQVIIAMEISEESKMIATTFISYCLKIGLQAKLDLYEHHDADMGHDLRTYVYVDFSDQRDKSKNEKDYCLMH